MATAQNLIERAIRLLGEGRNPDSDELSDGLIALNAMIGGWSNQPGMCFAVRDEHFNLVASQRTYSIGPSGADLVTDRPNDIQGAYVIVNNLTIPVRVLETPQEYAGIRVKTQLADWPLVCYYEPDMPNGTLYVYRVPNATVEMHILTRTPVTAFALSDTVSLPPGYEEAIPPNLAIALSPEYETEPRQAVVLAARNTKRAIRKQNAIPVVAKPVFARLRAAHVDNIIADGQ